MSLNQLDKKEQTIVELISAVSGQSKKDVRQILQSLCIVSTMGLYKQLEEERYNDEEEKEIVVPYIGKLKFTHSEKVDPKKNGKVLCIDSSFGFSSVFKKELECIFDGMKTPSQKLFESGLRDDLKIKLDLEDMQLGDD